MVRLFFVLLFLWGSRICFAQQPSGHSAHYVVIGAFAVHKNAIDFTQYTNEVLHMEAQWMLNARKDLYYVYVLETPEHAEARRVVERLRNTTELRDAWVYGDGEATPPIAQDKPLINNDVNSVDAPASLPVEQPKPDTLAMASVPRAADRSVGGKKFFFHLFNDANRDTISGNVDIIDADRSKKLGTHKGNSVVTLTPPAGNGSISVVCDVFGYRKTQRDIDYNNPAGDDITIDANGATVVPFSLIRLRKGDIVVMYNVFFYNDAAVMRPESRYEVNKLLEMLKQHGNCKIRIHGHTNGGAAGKIISMGSDRDDFFSLAKSKTGFGSAKQLSEERAEAIRQYLISQSIAPERMEVKAWGGKRPLYDKNSARARENVRVEIEILED